ncbi:MAG: hypothetical protein H0U27_14025 [Nitrosopumilus sp.]|nr:hypothetical protein [Nitrosopumilus sp.]
MYQKTFFPSRFTIGSKKFLGYTENNGAHPLDFKENDKEKVYLSSLEIGVFLDNLPSRHNVDLERATCHSIKEGFANEAYLMTICQLVISENKFCRDFQLFFEIKVIEVIPVCFRLRNVNPKTLSTSRALKLSLKPISLTPKVFSALFLHKNEKSFQC